MNAVELKRKPISHRGLFLFFVVGLFMLQIAFAFTIHGDIGPQTPSVPGIDRPASPLLVGRIDSLITQPCTKQPVHPVPEAVLAPADKKISESTTPKKHGTTSITPTSEQPQLNDKGGRYFEYTIGKGDTLESISKRLYGNGRMVLALVRLNRIKDEKNLKLGDHLLAPRTKLVKKVTVQK